MILALAALGAAVHGASAATSSTELRLSTELTGAASGFAGPAVGEFDVVPLTVGTLGADPYSFASGGLGWQSVEVQAAGIGRKAVAVDLHEQGGTFMVSAPLTKGSDFPIRVVLRAFGNETQEYSLQVTAPYATEVEVLPAGVYLPQEAPTAASDSIQVGPAGGHLDIVLHVPLRFGSGRYPVFFNLSPR